MKIFKVFSPCKQNEKLHTNSKPFELEELMGGNHYATIVRSPKVGKWNLNSDILSPLYL